MPRGAIEIQALIADMHPASNDRSATPFSWPVPDTAFGERARASNAGSLSAIPSRSDPRNQASPQHGLYNELQRCLPDASQDRLLQFTAACHKNRITADDLSEVHLNHDRLTLSFSGDDPISNRVTVDLNFPPPEAETSIREIHQIDQQRNEAMQQSQQRSNQMAQGFSI